MAIVFPDGGLGACLNGILVSFSGPMHVRLYTNDKEPGRDDVVSDYTEADFAGYFAQLLPVAMDSTVVDHVGYQVYQPSVVFEKGSGTPNNDIYGYFVTDGEENLVWAERDPAAPVTMQDEGSQYRIAIRVELRSQYPAPIP